MGEVVVYLTVVPIYPFRDFSNHCDRPPFDNLPFPAFLPLTYIECFSFFLRCSARYGSSSVNSFLLSGLANPTPTPPIRKPFITRRALNHLLSVLYRMSDGHQESAFTGCRSSDVGHQFLDELPSQPLVACIPNLLPEASLQSRRNSTRCATKFPALTHG